MLVNYTLVDTQDPKLQNLANRNFIEALRTMV